MRKLFLIAAIVLSTTTAHAGLSDADTPPAKIVADTTPTSTVQPSSGQPSQDRASAARDAARDAARQQGAMRQRMMMQQRMAMQQQMARHPIRTRLQMGLYKFKRRLHFAFR
jgi:hypothetical protein